MTAIIIGYLFAAFVTAAWCVDDINDGGDVLNSTGVGIVYVTGAPYNP